MGRFILQDPSFIASFNTRSANTDSIEYAIDTNIPLKEMPDHLKGKGNGLWAYSAKYPNLKARICYLSAKKKEEHKSLLEDNKILHNIMLTCYEDLPYEVKEKLNHKDP